MPPLFSELKKRLLVHMSGDNSDLLFFAIEWCRGRPAELSLPYLRSMEVTRMGPNPLLLVV